MTDLGTLDATAQAELVRQRAASPVELVQAAIDRIERVDPILQAVIAPRFERALEEAAAVDPAGRPFGGVPYLLKDLACPMAGEPQYEGMRALVDAHYVATVDSHLVRRVRGAGLLVLGRSKSPELGTLPTTEPLAFGPAHNPWDPARTPGGSSGGAAAAVAAGIVPAAHASDGGGSIRIPASCCGCVGLKTSRGRVSVGPTAGDLSRFLSVQFALTRSVRDAAALLDAFAGPEPGDLILAPPPSRPYRDEVGASPGRMRIGVMTDRPGGATDPVHPDCVAACESTAALLEELGHHVEVAHPEALDDGAAFATFGAVWSANTAFAIRSWGDAIGRTLGDEDVEPVNAFFASTGREVSGVELLLGLRAIESWVGRLVPWWQDGFDLLCTPTLAEPPPPLGTLSTPDDPVQGLVRTSAFVPFTPPFNLSGQPAISLPLARNADGLPIGVQLVAAYGREDLLLRVASQLEQARPWAGERPPVRA